MSIVLTWPDNLSFSPYRSCITYARKTQELFLNKAVDNKLSVRKIYEKK